MTTEGSQYCKDPTLAAINGKLESAIIVSGLHIVSTPIGNLADISLRALATLRGSDLIICEDTRVTAKIKSAFAITTPLLCYNDHNAPKTLPKIMELLQKGKIIKEKDLNDKLFYTIKEIYEKTSILDEIRHNQRQYSDKNVYKNINKFLKNYI